MYESSICVYVYMLYECMHVGVYIGIYMTMCMHVSQSEWCMSGLWEIFKMVCLVGKPFNTQSWWHHQWCHNDVMDDIICSLKSYIMGGVRFHGTQHSMISLSIHWFGSRTVHWSSGNYLLLLSLVSEFIWLDQFIMECLLSLYDDVIKNFVLIIQGIDHIGITQSGYKMYGKL